MLTPVSAFVVIVIVVVVLALLLLGLVAAAIALFVAWLRGLWQEFRRTPVVNDLSRRANLAKPLLAYRETLRLAPPEATSRTMRIQRKAIALERISDQLGDEERFRVEETTRRYLPDTMHAYQLAVTGADLPGRREASRLLIKQLAQIEGSVDAAAATAGENGMRVLEANGRFLSEIKEDQPWIDVPDRLPEAHTDAPLSSSGPDDGDQPSPGPR